MTQETNFQEMRRQVSQPMRPWEHQETLQDAVVATGNGTALNTLGALIATCQVVIANTATVTFEATINGTDWVAVRAVSVADGAVSTTATASGIFKVPLDGVRQFRARVSAWTSGAVTVIAVLQSSSSGIDLPA